MARLLVDELLSTARMPRVHAVMSETPASFVTACGRSITRLMAETYEILEEDSTPCGTCRTILSRAGEIFPAKGVI